MNPLKRQFQNKAMIEKYSFPDFLWFPIPADPGATISELDKMSDTLEYKGWKIEKHSGVQVGDYLTGKYGERKRGRGRKLSGVIAKSPLEFGGQEKFFDTLKEAKEYIDNY